MITPVFHVKVEFEAANTPEAPQLSAIVDAFKTEVLDAYPFPVLRLNPKVWRMTSQNDNYHLFAEVAELEAAKWVEGAMHRAIDGNGGKAVGE